MSFGRVGEASSGNLLQKSPAINTKQFLQIEVLKSLGYCEPQEPPEIVLVDSNPEPSEGETFMKCEDAP